MAIDLTGAQRTVESFMTDACEIRVDPSGNVDDVLDPVTLQLVPPDPDADLVYRGVCALSLYTGSTRAQPASETVLAPGGASSEQLSGDYTGQRYKLLLPLHAASPPVGARVTCTKCVRSPELAGSEYVVDDAAPSGTFAVARRVWLRPAEVP